MKKILLIPVLFFAVQYIHAEDLRGDTIDIRSYIIKLDLSDFTGKVLKGDAVMGVKSKKNGVEGIRLDLLLLSVDSVKVNSFTAPFTYNDSVLDVNLLTTLNTNDSATVEVFYHGTPFHASGDFGGFYWTSTYAFNIGVSFLSDPHNYGRVWFPCFDNFEERSLYEFYVTTKNTHKAFCNGIMQGVITAGVKKTWHWKLAQEIPSYLASVAVANYATVNDTINGMNGAIPIQLAAEAGDTTTLKNLFIHLHDAFHMQEEMWGPYLWDRVGYCIVPFNAGAMEHATNIGFMSYYLNQLADQAETTMAHELSHHWFGDLVTCDSASEMWLNEGWAVYNEYLFLEKLYGDSAYKQAVRENHEFVLHNAHIRDGNYLPVSGVPTENTYGTTVYDKGADVIHTLRAYMGDFQFFNCVKNYLNDFKWQTVSTAQLRDYLSQCSGASLSNYFNDWVYSPGFPHFEIQKVVQGTHILGPNQFHYYTIDIKQRLHHAPRYYNNVPITLSFFDGTGLVDKGTVYVSGECTQIVTGDFWGVVPEYIALDFDGNIQDAITDEWINIKDTGTYDFGTAKMVVHATAYNNLSNIKRVLHNLIRPEPMQTKIAGLHLHDKRYWAVEGNGTIGDATGTIAYDGTDVSLDSTFFTNSEDSLVVMFRTGPLAEWAIADSFSINTQGSSTDKKGTATIYHLQNGQYCFAIWNSLLPDTTTAEADCVFTTVQEVPVRNDFKLFPNPTNESVSVSFGKNVFLKAELLDLTGKKLAEHKITVEQTTVQFSTKNFANGTYLVTLTGKDNLRTTKKLIRQ